MNFVCRNIFLVILAHVVDSKAGDFEHTLEMGHYSLAPHIIELLKEKSDSSEKCIKTLLDDFNKLNNSKKELFIYFINEITEKENLSCEKLKLNVEKAYEMVMILKSSSSDESWFKGTGDWLQTKVKGVFSKESEIDWDTLIGNAIKGNKNALEALQNIDFKVLRYKPFMEKLRILKIIQTAAKKLIDDVTKDVEKKNAALMKKAGDDLDKLAIEQKQIGLYHSACMWETIKYCKDVIYILDQMSNHVQKILLTIDRATYCPIINMIDFEMFGCDVFATQRILQEKAKELSEKGLLQIPIHNLTKPIFYKQLSELGSEYCASL